MSSSQFVALALFCGALYLLFDAARYFLFLISPVRLRRLSGSDPQFERGSRWFQYSPLHFSLISGALLQMALVGSVAFTAIALTPGRTAISAGLLSALICGVVTVVWKMLLALIPENVAEFLLKTIIPVSYLFYYLFWPILFPLRWLLERLSVKRNGADDEEEITEEEVQAYIDVGEEEGILEEGEGKLVHSIVDFGDRVAKELMTPRIEILAVEASASLEKLASIFAESKYSRIPIYEGNIDKIVGILHVKDVFEAHLRQDGRPARELALSPFFVLETKKVAELLKEFQLEHLQLAVVVDEFGGTAGIVTIEDLLEEIVGDIADEHEDAEESLVEIDEGVLLVNGLVRVETLEETLGVDIRGDGYETVAGLIFTQIGRVPKAGEKVSKNGVIFEVERADRKRIYRVRVTRETALSREESQQGWGKPARDEP